MSDSPSFRMPPRYVPVARLGKGGGGEVWAVTDRLRGRKLALKILAEDAGEAESLALVREAVTLSGLEGLGVPRVIAFGRLPGGSRRYMVRELVEGESLEAILALETKTRSPAAAEQWLRPLAYAADQLTVLHRAALLHGDIKPANVIVGPDGSGTLVDLGLAAPWREGGTRPAGLTPKYAAPELLQGEPLTVRAEVYALGATLAEAIEARGRELSDDVRAALDKVAKRATSADPQARFPSIDELASALRSAASIDTPAFEGAAAWPVVGADAAALDLMTAATRLSAGDALAVQGPARSGRTTLLRRLSWSLGISGTPVANVEDASGSDVRAELDAWKNGEAKGRLVLVVDDLEKLDPDSKAEVRSAVANGARLVAVGSREALATMAKTVTVFDVPALDPANAKELVQRAVPSLANRLVDYLVERVEGRPGPLRAFVKSIGDRPITSTDAIEEILNARTSLAPTFQSHAEGMTEVMRALDTGRFDQGSSILDRLPSPATPSERVEVAVARAKIALGRADEAGARKALEPVADEAETTPLARHFAVMSARTELRGGNFAKAGALAEKAVASPSGKPDALSADALSVRGVALVFVGELPEAMRVLNEAVTTAKAAKDARIESVALGSLAIAHQRAGRTAEARQAYEGALSAAEKAEDAWMIGTTRSNLAGLAKADGDLAQALVHLEAALDMGRRVGGVFAVQSSLFNLANLDLYLGRYARAGASIERLAALRDALSPNARAQLLGLEAEHATRSGDAKEGARLYQLSAEAYDVIGRPLDAAEARLEGILARLGPEASSAEAGQLAREVDALAQSLGEGGFREHTALASIVRGSIALARRDERAARAAFDAAHATATKAGLREWAWRALDARARLARAEGAHTLARRDTEAALAMLEETAAKLPRDLREVFWNDPRRRALRQGGVAAVNVPLAESSARISLLSGRTSITSLGGPLPEADRLARIFEITRDLARERDLDRLLVRVTDHAVGLLGAERGLIVLVDDDGKVVAHTARDSKGEEAAQNFSRSVAEAVIQSGEPVIAASARDDERLAQAVSVHQLMIQSIACVPIRGAPPAGRTIGALYVETRLRPGVRFREELPTLAAFADQAAIAIEGARLLDENRRRAEELESANVELVSAKERLAELLGLRTEQLESARRNLKEARRELRGHFGYGGLVGTSAAMRKVYALIERIKDTDVPVLITGESGTGKEVVAKAVHNAGPRAKKSFLGVNCGAIPANLLESELFGHVRGAFTGADRDRKGLFREAEDGTILLDEIGEMPTKMQAGMLRVLQERTVRPVGGLKEEPCSARVIAATNRDLSAMVADGSFREDLFYRLHVVELRIPPLRERAEDIPPLIDHFLTLFSARHKRERKTLERAALRRLQSFDWPGNVRQLEHVLLNAWLLSETREITAEDFDLPAQSVRAPSTTSEKRSVVRAKSSDEHRDVEKDQILSALTRCNWNRVQAARLVGMPRRTFYRRLKDYGIL